MRVVVRRQCAQLKEKYTGIAFRPLPTGVLLRQFGEGARELLPRRAIQCTGALC